MKSNPKSSTLSFKIKWYLALVSGLSVDWAIPVWQLLGYLGQFRETGSEYPKSCAGTDEK